MAPFDSHNNTVSELLSNECLWIECDKAIKNTRGFVITKAIFLFVWLAAVIIIFAIAGPAIFSLSFSFPKNKTWSNLGILAALGYFVLAVINIGYTIAAANGFENIFKNLKFQQFSSEQDQNRINHFQQMLISSRKMKNLLWTSLLVKFTPMMGGFVAGIMHTSLPQTDSLLHCIFGAILLVVIVNFILLVFIYNGQNKLKELLANEEGENEIKDEVLPNEVN